MGHTAEKKKKYTVEEFFQLDESSDLTYDFYDGEIFPVENTTQKHNEIVHNILIAMRAFFRPKGCRIRTENVKLEVIKDFYYPNPDVMLSCDPDDEDNKMLKFPTIIVEVLSSNSNHDRNFKWRNYRKMPSLRYYLLVSQDDFHVEMYARSNNNALWIFRDYDNLEDIISFPDLEFDLPLNLIYEGIVIEANG